MWRYSLSALVGFGVGCGPDCPKTVDGLGWTVVFTSGTEITTLEDTGASSCDVLCRMEEYGIEPSEVDSCSLRLENGVQKVDCVGTGHPDCV